MFKNFTQIWKSPDLMKSILFVLAMLVIFRFAAQIPLPGVNLENLKHLFENNQFLGLMNVFSGGGLDNFSIVAMSVGPYITASIIMQLLAMIVPKLEAISKDGEYGRQKINQYTRYLTIPMAILQAYGLIIMFKQYPKPIIDNLDPWTMVITILTMTAGTMFVMWLGELISEKHIGNGISLIIFAGIVSGLPGMLIKSLNVYDSSQILNVVLFAVIAVITIILVVVMTEGQRNIPVSYARQMRGAQMSGGLNSHLPLRVLQAGVIPIIFAISMIIFPSTIAQFFLHAKTAWLVQGAQAVIAFFNNQLAYGIIYFLLVVGFTYFYTAVVFKPDQIAENLQKQGAFVPGIRPGKPTVEYLTSTVNKIILPGALFLGLIAILPLTMQSFTGLSSMTIGGTSLLIVVSVVIETFKQLDAQLAMRNYEDLI